MSGTLSRYGSTLLGFATAIASSFAGPLLAQQPTRITSDVVCPDCSLALEHVVTLGTRDGPGYLVGDPITVARDGRGFYYVLQFREGDAVPVYNATGAFVRRIGQRGAGPGEYQRIAFIRVGRGDTLHVYDVGTQRHSVLDPSWEYVTGRPLRHPILRVVELENGEEVYNGAVYSFSPERFGFFLHTFDEEGHPRRSFGDPDSLAIERGLPYLWYRRLTAGGGNRVWVAPPNRYVLELWDTDGNKQAELVREADWFEPWVERAPSAPDQRPPPMLFAIHVGPEGKLWVAIHVPAEDWAERLGPPVETPRGPRYRPSSGAYDTIIEVIDTERGRLVLSERIGPSVGGFIDEHHLFAYREDEEGVPYIDVWRIELRHGQ